jgi:hypothetical protein
VRLFVPLLPPNAVSAVKLASTPVAYVPALIPLTLTFERVATPEVFVVADPAGSPFSLNATLLPLTPVAPDFSVAERLVVPPYVAVAGAAASVVAADAAEKWAYA